MVIRITLALGFSACARPPAALLDEMTEVFRLESDDSPTYLLACRPNARDGERFRFVTENTKPVVGDIVPILLCAYEHLPSETDVKVAVQLLRADGSRLLARGEIFNFSRRDDTFSAPIPATVTNHFFGVATIYLGGDRAQGWTTQAGTYELSLIADHGVSAAPLRIDVAPRN